MRVLCDSTGRGRMGACAWLPPALPHAPFPCVDSALQSFLEQVIGVSKTRR